VLKTIRKTGLIAIILVVLAALMASCNSTTSSTSTTATQTSTTSTLTTAISSTSATTTAATIKAAASLTITDDYGRKVTVKKYPQRIVSLSPSHTEILFALGLGDRVVGVCEYSDFPAEAANKPSVGSYNAPNLEQIVALEPDLVLASEEHETETDALAARGITVVALNPKTVADVMAKITLVGQITGQDAEAAAVTGDMQKRIDAVTAKTKNLTAGDKPRVFVVIWHDPVWTVGAHTFHDELIQMAGGVNVAGNMEGYTAISMEDVLAANPQVIIAGVGMGEGSDLSLAFMRTDARLKDTDARLNQRIYGANMDIISRPGPRLADALELMFKLIHPEMQ
jgi:iron complex transport system substrate-binding protein